MNSNLNHSKDTIRNKILQFAAGKSRNRVIIEAKGGKGPLRIHEVYSLSIEGYFAMREFGSLVELDDLQLLRLFPVVEGAVPRIRKHSTPHFKLKNYLTN